MNVTVNGISAKVEWEGFRKARTDDGPRVLIRYQVPFASGDAFADSVMGGIVVTGGPSGTVSNLPRQPCPTNPKLYALHADLDYAAERDDVGGSIAFDTALVTVEYGQLTWAQQATDDPGGEQSFPNELTPGQPFIFAECEIDHASEVVTVANAGLTFSSAPAVSVDLPISIRSPISTYRIVRHQYPNLPSQKVMTMIGQLNDATFLGRTRGLVLFDDCRTRQVMAADGTRCQGFELVFKVKVRDWNRFIRPDKMVWETVADGSGNTPYTYTNLLPLLQ
jgi:hypothetical protein